MTTKLIYTHKIKRENKSQYFTISWSLVFFNHKIEVLLFSPFYVNYTYMYKLECDVWETHADNVGYKIMGHMNGSHHKYHIILREERKKNKKNHIILREERK
jgi:hypothetical protein